jgi:cation diffusion facilitator family transporter
MSVSDQNRRKAHMAYLSVVSNSVLLTAKITAGIIIGSVSVISEGIHSGIDLIAAVIAFIAVRKSSQPPDKKHSYGHGKVENISGAVEAVLILAASVLIVREAIEKIVQGVEIEDVNLGIVVMLISCLVNIYVSSRLFKTARQTESIALEADAWHLRTDVFTSLGIFLGLVIIKLTGMKILDPIMALMVAVLIVKAAVDLIRKSVRDLIDVSLPVPEQEHIKAIIRKHAGNFFEFHEMRTRRAGSDRFIDFHLVVCQNTNISSAHNLADKMEKEIMQEFPRASVIIHVEPCENLNNCNSCGKSIKAAGA